MRADLVVMTPPVLDDGSGLLQGIEDFTIQKLIQKLRVEPLVIAIHPGAAEKSFVTKCVKDASAQ